MRRRAHLLEPSAAKLRNTMREFGVRRYGDAMYHHCLADSEVDAAGWFSHSKDGMAGKNFQALVKDVSKPVTDEAGYGGNPAVVQVRPGPLTVGARAAQDLKRTSPIR
jgi:hypothetical protein